MDDYGNFPGGASPQQLQQPPQPPPAQALPPDVPWTTNDDISLAKHNQDLSTLNGKLDDGELTLEEHGNLMQQIMPRLTNLQQRQQKSQQQAEQKGIQQAMHQQAMQQSIISQNLKFHASSFPDTLAETTDPITGVHQKWQPVLDSKGNVTEWKPLIEENYLKHRELDQSDFPGGGPPSGAGQSYQRPGHEPSQMQKDVASAFDEPKPLEKDVNFGDTTPADMADVFQKAEQMQKETGKPTTLEQIGQALRQPPGDPKIMNALGEEIPSGGRSVQQRDEWGRPTGPPPGAAPHVMAEFRRRAEQTFPRPNVSGLPPAQAAHVLQNWEGQIQSMVTHQMTQKERTEEHQRHETAMVAERQRKEASDAKDAEETRKQKQQDRVDLAKQKQQERLDLVHERQTKEKTLTEQQDMQHIKEISDDVRREHTEAAKEYKNDNSKEIPEEIATPAARHAEIIKRFKERKKAMQDLRKGEKPEGAPATGIGGGLGAGAAGGTEEGAAKGPGTPADQARGVDALMQKLLNPKEAPRVTKEVPLVRPDSEVSHEEVGRLKDYAIEEYNKTSGFGRMGGEAAQLGEVTDMLIKAHREGRGLKPAEVKRLETFRVHVHSLGSKTAREWHANLKPKKQE